ncbi:glutathione-dependent formaldehyde-activating enzyme domain-containing protein [Trichoderma breve]|uniref:Glutathione-dependent formaldehyde-activating enzyme domain-containing protein n=1 Tax=Trichoderma breve TaxID=2034170 RepID=A0A9W9EER8_9HYPO|nr:glutathione-dependent formaldehyde-activating enzyme domain-containing protein [Trichoderma breve]KAJ4865478.1 glutathione-dependent formaldehyde-activating enzyme domain-containing protein [Trichoderma breve]
MASTTGSCNCGSITVSLSAPPSKTVACHCLNCRRAGGPYSINYVMDESEVKVDDVRDTLNEYEDYKTASGNLGRAFIQRNFCKACGSPIYTIDITMPGKLLIKASLFDDIVEDRMDVFLDRKIQWSG